MSYIERVQIANASTTTIIEFTADKYKLYSFKLHLLSVKIGFRLHNFLIRTRAVNE